ncbi:MAG: hypothetical protein MHPDNHAH_00409 [Anaerolineales bacterium]|nr:hypothetical protein [Anaerolineales bacterium]
MTDTLSPIIRQTKTAKDRRVGFRKLVGAGFLLFILLGCNLLAPTPPPSEPILVDAFFSGYAYLDVNGNGEIDSEDTPLENAMFIVTLQGGMEIGDTTDENGNAFITIPGGVDYPVNLRMEAPKDSALKLIGPSSVTFPSDEPAKFLFTSK